MRSRRASRRCRDDRPVHLVLENEANQSSRLRRDAGGAPVAFTAQWNDDLHHVLHTAVTGEGDSYYRSYVGDSEKLGRALAEGFAFQGETMEHTGRPRGEPSATLPPTAFIGFIQNHDQVGNRAFGERLGAIATAEAVAAVTAVYLLIPQVPMIFMGEEWGASTPFLFFCDLGEDLAPSVRDGRRREFERFPAFRDPAIRERIPDPSDPATFAASKLTWEERNVGPARAVAGVLQDPPRRPAPRDRAEAARRRRALGRVRAARRRGTPRRLDHGRRIAPDPRREFLRHRRWRSPGADRGDGRLLWSEGSATADALGPWSVVFRLRDAT